MKNKRYTWIYGALMSVFLLGHACQSLLERDISDNEVELYSPPDSMQSDVYLQTFWWEEISGATSYNLQIVAPSFEYTRRLILDTNVVSNQFTYTFAPDTFAWRVKAFNDAYETPYTRAMFVIDSTEKPQMVNLISPANNMITNSESIPFKWAKAKNATRYRVLLVNNEATFAEKQVDEGTTVTFPDENLGLPQLTDGVYNWSVRSENTLANSEYTAPWKITVDLIAPQTPIITAPKNDTINDFKLSWRHQETSGTTISDSLIIYYKDSSGINLYHRQFTVDTSYVQNTAPEGWYQFKVKSIDAATNASEWTGIRRFYYKEKAKVNKQ